MLQAADKYHDARLLARSLQAPTAFPEFNPAGYNTSTYAYPATEHGNEPYFNQFDDIEIRECTFFCSHTARLSSADFFSTGWQPCTLGMLTARLSMRTHSQTNSSSIEGATVDMGWNGRCTHCVMS